MITRTFQLQVLFGNTQIIKNIQVSQLFVHFFYPYRDNITEKVEKIIFGKFVAVTFALVLKNQLKQHTGGQPLSDGCYFL